MAKEIVPELITVSNTELKDSVNKETNNQGVNLSIIAASSPESQEEGFDYMAINGRVLFFGGLPKGRELVKLDSNVLHYKQLRVFGCTRASLSTYRTAVKLVAGGRIPVAKLITHRYTIGEFSQALENAVKSVGRKNIILFNN